MPCCSRALIVSLLSQTVDRTVAMSRSSTSRPLQVARGFHSVRNSEGQGLCRSAWNTRDACFEECVLPFIFAVPFLLSIIVLVVRVGRPLAAYLPQWMRPFITKPEQASKRSWDGHQRIASFQGRLLLCLSLTGLIVEVTIALSSGSTIPGLLPVAAWVSHKNFSTSRKWQQR